MALRTGEDRILVGPDNGLLAPATAALGGAARGGRPERLAVPPAARHRDLPRPRPVRPGQRPARRRSPARGGRRAARPGHPDRRSSCPGRGSIRTGVVAHVLYARRLRQPRPRPRARRPRRPPSSSRAAGSWSRRVATGSRCRSPAPSATSARVAACSIEDSVPLAGACDQPRQRRRAARSRARRRGDAVAGELRFGLPRHHHRRCDSTNTRARELAAAGAPAGTIVTAAEQSGGRGRQGRSWSAPPARRCSTRRSCDRSTGATCCCRWPCRWRSARRSRRSRPTAAGSSGRTTSGSGSASAPGC